MKTYLECVPCFLQQALAASRMATDNIGIQEEIMRAVLKLAAEMSFSRTPVHMGRDIHRKIKEISGNADPYRDLKQHFNKEALALYPELKDKIRRAEKPLEMAVRLAIAGNIIDFGINSNKDGIRLQETITDSCVRAFAISRLAEFAAAVRKARNILYLGDNAGELVFDRLLVEEMPTDRVTFAVKSQPIINDATLEDARLAGLAGIVKVITNGADAPGTILEDCSGEFKAHFQKADLIIAKGQGNYESLNDLGKENIFFLLKAKCPVIARDLGCEVGSIILTSGNGAGARESLPQGT